MASTPTEVKNPQSSERTGPTPGEEDSPQGRAAAVGEVADTAPKDVSPAQRANATEWFLSTDEEEVAWAWLPVNVAPAGKKERIVEFKIQVVGRERIRELRRESEKINTAGVAEVDEMEANLKITVEGLLEPDVRNDPKMRNVRGQDHLDPGDALSARFAYKPGIIDQIATNITKISGYNDADVKEVRAAGN